VTTSPVQQVLDAVLGDVELVGDDGEGLLLDLPHDEGRPVELRELRQRLPDERCVLRPDDGVAGVDLGQVVDRGRVERHEARPTGVSR
jgi:hypothetical protein